jgi:hypothetical protein
MKMFKTHKIAIREAGARYLFRASVVGKTLGVVNVRTFITNFKNETTYLTEVGMKRPLCSIRKPNDLNTSANKIKQLEEELRIKTQELEKSKSQLLKLNDFVQAARELKKDEIFYIATTRTYAANNRFKYGGVAKAKDLPSRLASYNTGRPEGDLYYYCNIIRCHKYKHIENCMEMLVKGFKDKANGKKEMLHMRYNCLLELVEFIDENHVRDLEFINERAQKYIQATIELKPVIPPPVELGISRRSGAQIQKIDVSDWDEAKIQALIKSVIGKYAKEELDVDYDFETQANTRALQVVWKDLRGYFSEYSGKNITAWKSHLRVTLTGANRLTVKWRV